MKSATEKSRSAMTPAAGSLTTQFAGSGSVRSNDPDAFLADPHAVRSSACAADRLEPHLESPVRGHGPGDHAGDSVVQLHAVDDEGGPAAVVDDPVVPDHLRHLAAVEIHVHEQLRDLPSDIFGGQGGQNGNAVGGIDAALRPDVHLAVPHDMNASFHDLIHLVHLDRSFGFREVLHRREVPVGDDPGGAVAYGPHRRVCIAAIRDRDAAGLHPDVPCAVGSRPSGDARRSVMQHDIVYGDGRLAAVVEDPAIPQGLRHPAAPEVQVHPQLGRNGSYGRLEVVRSWNGTRGQDRDPRGRIDAAPRSDDDPTAVCQKHPFRGTFHRAVHRHLVQPMAFLALTRILIILCSQ